MLPKGSLGTRRTTRRTDMRFILSLSGAAVLWLSRRRRFRLRPLLDFYWCSAAGSVVCYVEEEEEAEPNGTISEDRVVHVPGAIGTHVGSFCLLVGDVFHVVHSVSNLFTLAFCSFFVWSCCAFASP